MRRTAAALWTALALSTAPAAAQSCRIALTMAIDVSSSVDAREYALQIEGLARALEDPEVRSVVFLVPGVHVALQVFEWSGESDQTIIQDWVLVRSDSDLDAMAMALRAHQRRGGDGQTALGAALSFAHDQLARAPECAERKIDVSGDGQTNVGILPQELYWEKNFQGITVNALAIEHRVTGLMIYFRDYMIRGPGAFVIRVASFDDYGEAIRLKLVRELSAVQVADGAPPCPGCGWR